MLLLVPFLQNRIPCIRRRVWLVGGKANKCCECIHLVCLASVHEGTRCSERLFTFPNLFAGEYVCNIARVTPYLYDFYSGYAIVPKFLRSIRVFDSRDVKQRLFLCLYPSDTDCQHNQSEKHDPFHNSSPLLPPSVVLATPICLHIPHRRGDAFGGWCRNLGSVEKYWRAYRRSVTAALKVRQFFRKS